MLAGAAAVLKATRDPGLIWLEDAGGASWILAEEPVNLVSRDAAEAATHFRAVFDAPAAGEFVLRYRLLRFGRLRVDGRELATAGDPSLWRREREVALAVSPGRHELTAVALRADGPAALWAVCPPLGLATGPGWEARLEEGPWAPARLARSPRLSGLSRRFPGVGEALSRRRWFLLGVFSAAALASLAAQRRRLSLPSPERLRWLLLAAWALLACGSLLRLPWEVGFDVGGHMQYVAYVARRWRLPLADEGWQMFQAPLFYVLSAPLFAAARHFGREAGAVAVRLLPWLCAAAQVELCRRALRLALPGREEAQSLGLLVGGLFPFLLYSAQYAGNEPLCSALTALTVVLAWRWSVKSAPTRAGLAALGACLGLALLAKSTPVLLIPPLAWFVAVRLGRGRTAVSGLGLAGGTALLVSGWFYLRNWVAFGKPFIGGWDPARGILWWQEPGFRVARHLLSFGESLSHPVYSGLAGFWDSLYSTFWLDGQLSSMALFERRPPWDYDLMLSCSWLALPLTAALLAGLWRAARRPSHEPLAFCFSSVLVYTAAAFWLYLYLPVFSTAKATYLGGLTPCFAVLIAAGLEPLLRKGRLVRAGLHGFLAAWAAAAYGAYFIR